MHPIRDLKTPNLLRPFEVVIWGENKDRPLYRCHVQAFSDDEAKADALRSYDSALGLTNDGEIVRRNFRDTTPIRVKRIDVCDGIRFTPHQRQHGLFEDIAEVCLGESLDNIQGAAVNLMLTAVQRRAKGLPDAEARWNELAGRGLQALRRRYDGQTDNRDVAAEGEIAKRVFG
jgi:hypothetical protein